MKLVDDCIVCDLLSAVNISAGNLSIVRVHMYIMYHDGGFPKERGVLWKLVHKLALLSDEEPVPVFAV